MTGEPNVLLTGEQNFWLDLKQQKLLLTEEQPIVVPTKLLLSTKILLIPCDSRDTNSFIHLETNKFVLLTGEPNFLLF